MATKWNDFKGAAKRIEDIDLPRIGHMIGVGEDEIHAVLDVESAGRGFDASGRPKMLFEPHIFYKELNGAQRTKAVNAGLAYPKWKPGAYPSDSYPRLIKAISINETAALRSASWGLGQVMGFNHRLAGFATPQAMVLAMMDDEDNHLEAMVDFIKNNNLDDDLRRHDWHGFARGYNGQGYARHGYHTKLANAYARWARIRDTPWSPDMIEAEWEADNTPMFDDEPVAEPAEEAADMVTGDPEPPVSRPVETDDVAATDPENTAPPAKRGFLAALLAILSKLIGRK